MLMTPNGGECFFGKKHFREAPTHNDDHDHDHDHDELFLWYGWRQKAFSPIYSRDHCQRSSLSLISDTPRTGIELAQNLRIQALLNEGVQLW